MKIKNRISLLKSSAKSRGIPVRLMSNEYENLINMGCMYCGLTLNDQNGVCLDRIDSDKGYTLHNVTPCCKRCNFAKNDMATSEFLDWLKKAYEHTQKMLNAVAQMQESNYKIEKVLHKQITPNGKFIGIKL